MTTSTEALTRTPSEVAREMFNGLFNERDLADPSRYWSDDSVDHFVALGMSVRGKEALARFFAETFAAFTDWEMNIEQTTDDGESRVVVQWTAQGTFDGAPWQGLEPTGKKLSIRGVDVMELDRNGKTKKNTVYYDAAAFARQIGMLPREGSMVDRVSLAVFNAATRAKARLSGRRG
jgi:steroid delta-isomerase-like uncharacterized protein